MKKTKTEIFLRRHVCVVVLVACVTLPILACLLDRPQMAKYIHSFVCCIFFQLFFLGWAVRLVQTITAIELQQRIKTFTTRSRTHTNTSVESARSLSSLFTRTRIVSDIDSKRSINIRVFSLSLALKIRQSLTNQCHSPSNTHPDLSYFVFGFRGRNETMFFFREAELTK